MIFLNDQFSEARKNEISTPRHLGHLQRAYPSRHELGLFLVRLGRQSRQASRPIRSFLATTPNGATHLVQSGRFFFQIQHYILY